MVNVDELVEVILAQVSGEEAKAKVASLMVQFAERYIVANDRWRFELNERQHSLRIEIIEDGRKTIRLYTVNLPLEPHLFIRNEARYGRLDAYITLCDTEEKLAVDEQSL